MSAPSPTSLPARGLDVATLTQPVDEPALTAFIADSKATGQPWCTITTGLPRPGVSEVIEKLLPVVIPLIALVAFLRVGGLDLVRAVVEFTLEAPFPLNLVIVGFLLLIALGMIFSAAQAVMIIRSLIIPRSWWEAAFRLTGFARANQLAYGHDEQVSHPGVIFGTGTDRVAERRLTTTVGRRLEIGNYRYTVSGEDRDSASVYGWGYVAITLDRRLPHLLLDAKANDRSLFGLRRSNLPVELTADQRLSLGGEFDERFTLYAPVDYGRDAFAIFTPDVMALFLDRLGTFDVEIVDDTMFVYGARFDLLDPQTYAWLEEVVETVVARTVRRTERYRDDFALLETDPSSGLHSAPAAAPAATGPTAGVLALGGDGPGQPASNTVAARGRRLRRRTWTSGAILGLLIIAFWAYNEVVAPLLGLPRWDG